MEYDERTGKMFSVKPLPLFIIRSKEDKLGEGDNADKPEGEEGATESKPEEGSQQADLDKPKQEE